MSRTNSLNKTQPEIVSLCVENDFTTLLFSNAKNEIIEIPF